jgi:hypothetical protein
MVDPTKTTTGRKTSDSSGYDAATEIECSSHQLDTAQGPEISPKTPDQLRREANLKLANPLGSFSMDRLGDMGEQYCRDSCLREEEDIRAFRLGAQVAKDPLNFEGVTGLTEEERMVFRDEIEHKWRQPKLLYLVIGLCSMCAAVQGMGEWLLLLLA